MFLHNILTFISWQELKSVKLFPSSTFCSTGAQIHLSKLLPGGEVFSDSLATFALLSLSCYEPN